MVISSLVLFIFGFIGIGTVNANESEDNLFQSVIEITNDETGEKISIDPSNSNNDIEINPINTGSGYDVFIPIDDESSNLITPFATGGSTKTSGGVTARIFVDYDWRSSTGKLRMNRVYGSWSPSSNIYSVTNRSVIAHNGGLPGTGLKKLSKSPSSNSFSYSTGWGFQSVPEGGDGAMAESSAKIKVSGMSATHTITLRVFVP